MQRPKQVNIRIYKSTYRTLKELKKPFKKMLMLNFMDELAKLAKESRLLDINKTKYVNNN